MYLTTQVQPVRRARIVGAITLFSLLAACWATPASAQLTRVTSSIGVLSTTFIRGTDAAYDPVNNVYLLVGGYGPIFGVFTDTSGNALGSFGIGSSNLSAPFGHFPRAKYSPDVNGGKGGFLVTWHQNDTNLNFVHSVIVGYPTGVISANVTLSDGAQAGSKWEAGAAIAYSKTSKRFLVSWQTFLFGIQGRLVDINGSPIGGVIDFENAGGARDPGLAWNASTDEFGLSYTGWDGTSAFARFRKVTPAGALSARTTFGRTSGTFNTDVEVNPTTNNYVMAYATGTGSFAAEFDASGILLGSGLISTKFGGSDNLSLAYNATSGTFLSAGQHVDSFEVGGAELNSRGVPTTGLTILTSGSSKGSFYPRVAARTGVAQWNVVYSRNFTTITNQIIGTSSTGGGSTSALGGTTTTTTTTTTPVPTPVTTPVSSCPGSDPFSSIGGGTCVNGGWKPPTTTVTATPAPAAPAPTIPVPTSSCPGNAPVSGWVCVNGGWLPPTHPLAIAANAASAPVVVPTDPTPSAPTPPVPTSSCSGNAPVSGWVCVNGGWLPPNHPLALAALAAPAPTPSAPAPAPSAPPASTCSIPNPFPTSLGGVCLNGGWVPGNSSLARLP